MTPFFFGPEDRRLFGIFRRASSRGTTAALLCNPYGPEATRSHRIYRVLADELASNGVDVLRFDYFATGDSAGEDDAGDLSGWSRDIACAHQTLVERTGAQRVAWFGTRLGAAIAVMATRHVERAPNLLLLWDALVDGKTYLLDIRQGHIRDLEESYDPQDFVWQTMLDDGSMALDREAVGFEMSARLRAQLEELSRESLRSPRALRCVTVVQPGAASTTSLASKWRREGLIVDQLFVEHGVDWLRPTALNSAVVPREAIRQFTRLIVEQ